MSSSRSYDIVVFGATGFSGKLLAEYLVEHYTGDVKIALAGRNQKRLETVRDQLCTIRDEAKDLPILLGDSGDLESLLAIARQTKCIATTVGPYAKYGSLLVEACAKSGTNYCDLTGEPTWHGTMFNLHDKEAKASGARIVHHCGFDSVPSDIGTKFAAEEFRKRYGEDAARIEMVIQLRGRGGIQGGTLDTVMNELENGATNRRLLRESRTDAPPLPDNGTTRLEWSKGISWSQAASCWCIPFFMASCNQPCISRSNGRLSYSKALVYNERQGFKSLLAALAFYTGLLMLGVLLFIPPTRWFLKRFVLPAPGQGPSRETMNSGSYRVNFTATGSGDKALNVQLDAVGDASCISTTCCLAESAVCLSKDVSKLASTGGVMTPAYAMSDALLARLRNTPLFNFSVVDDTLAAKVGASKM